MKLIILCALVAAAMGADTPTPRPTTSPSVQLNSGALKPGQTWCNTDAVFFYERGDYEIRHYCFDPRAGGGLTAIECTLNTITNEARGDCPVLEATVLGDGRKPEYSCIPDNKENADRNLRLKKTTYPVGTGATRCEYWQECHQVSGLQDGDCSEAGGACTGGGTTDLSFCMDKGNHACYKYSKLVEWAGEVDKEGGLIVMADQCEPSESCCDGKCCQLFSGACMDQTQGDFTYGWSQTQWANSVCLVDNRITDHGRTTIDPSRSGKNCDATSGGIQGDVWSYYNNNQYKAEHMMRNGNEENTYKTEWGEDLEHYPRTCMASKTYMNPTAGLKVVYIPVLGILIGAFCAKTAMEGESSAKMICVVMIILSMLLQFSYYPQYAFVTMGIATATAKVGGRGWAGNWVCFFQIFIFWYFMNGETFLFRAGDKIEIGSSGNFIDDIKMETTALAPKCATYFNFFGYDGTNNKKWWSSNDRQSWGYCSVEWVGFQLFLAVTNFLLFFVVMVMTIADRVGNAIGSKGDEGAIITTAI